jgi:hypothetical protein
MREHIGLLIWVWILGVLSDFVWNGCGMSARGLDRDEPLRRSGSTAFR